MYPNPKIIVALDFSDVNEALAFVAQLSPQQCRLKVGKELFTLGGPQLVEKLVAKDFSVFLDLKFHDIPHTVARACIAAAKLGVWMMNVHALGGLNMLQAAREALDRCSSPSPLLIAVTLLTSMDQATMQQLGLSDSVEQQVLRLAKLSRQADVDGVVCSAQEAVSLREQFGQKFCLVTPGIRLSNNITDDQQRVVMPQQAVKNGADYLVIGRPITQAHNPVEKLLKISFELMQ
ncbi:MAG: orotidine-5'-phosphate decarboxylase [Gammaproteobacteria bacterium]|nr:orotidine-5'-phosphate decarboxylase [Gammaproteobacteria bacterium]